METSSNITSGPLRRFIDQKAIPQFVKNTYFYEKLGDLRFMGTGDHVYSIPVINRNTFTYQQAVLVEGVTPADQNSNFSTVDVVCTQYGVSETVTDIAVKDSPIDIYAYTAAELMRQMAQVVDTNIQVTLQGGTNVVYSGSATSRATVSAVASSTKFADIAAQMDALAAPRFDGGKFVSVIHPFVKRDLLTEVGSTTAGFFEASKYSEPENIFNGEFGEMFGIRFIESPNIQAFVGAGASGVNVYPSYVLGREAYVVVQSTPLETIVKPIGSGGTSDPLNQRGTVSVKIRFGSSILKPEALWRLESASSLTNNPIY